MRMQIFRPLRIKKFQYLILLLTSLSYTYYFFGVGDYIFAKTFDHFHYPLDIDVRSVAEKILEGEKVETEPINIYPHSFLTSSPICDCSERYDLIILVKSAVDHHNHRNAIRQSFGGWYSIDETRVGTVFFIGIDSKNSSHVQNKIDKEITDYKDIIQIDFLDSYFSNTNKTMMAFRWAFEKCNFADYYLFTDDDMYISVPNLLDFARNGGTPIKDNSANFEKNSSAFKVDAPRTKDQILYAGYVFDSAPLRMKSSKWVVSLDEYPWNKWPPYVTAGAYVVSNKALKLIYIGSQYIKHFRFDDIYLGIVAFKLNVKLTHSPDFHFYKKAYTKDGYEDVIASHGFDDHKELVSVWKEQISLKVDLN